MIFRYFIMLYFSFCCLIYSQNDSILKDESRFLITEFQVGKLSDANKDFPETSLQHSLFFSIGRNNVTSDKEWAYRLNYPKTGLSLGFTNLGNTENIGFAYSLLPFAEFSIFQKHTKSLNLLMGLGAAYIDTKYDPVDNPNNKGITTHLNWAFRSFLYYDVFHSSSIDWRLGLGYFHQSNGHTNLPNQGLNSFIASLSAKFNTTKKEGNEKLETPNFTSSSALYYSLRFGLGQNVLSEIFNSKKEVYAFSAEVGKIINKTFKFGGGFYYRFYEHYYDYINNKGDLVVEQYPYFKDNPFGYASNFGVFGTAEVLLDHLGLEFDLGLNIYKPFYKVDWQLNGYIYENQTGETLVKSQELDWYYEIKRTVSSRLGLKYYAWNTNKSPKHNLFLAAHINANLGQADFTEISLGYMRRLD